MKHQQVGPLARGTSFFPVSAIEAGFGNACAFPPYDPFGMPVRPVSTPSRHRGAVGTDMGSPVKLYRRRTRWSSPRAFPIHICPGGAGHFFPLIPLARALAADDHTVAFGAQTAMLSMVERAGFEAFDTGGPTTRDEAVRGPLLKFDMERECHTGRLRGSGCASARFRTP